LRLIPVPRLDNSFALDQDDMFDYVIFTGTPEWFDESHIKLLLQYILKNKIRYAFISVGIHRHHTFVLIPHDGQFQTTLKLKSHILQIGSDLIE